MGPGWHAEFVSVSLKLRQNLRRRVSEIRSLYSGHLVIWIHLITRFGHAMRIRLQFLDLETGLNGSSAVSQLVSSSDTRG